MFDFIPLYDYSSYFHYSILILVIIGFFQCMSEQVYRDDVVQMNAMWGTLFSVLIIFYMGLRPISYVFGDTVNYEHEMRRMVNASSMGVSFGGEWLYRSLLYFFANYSDIHMFLLLCSTIYVGASWLAMRRIFGNYYYIPLLVVFSMFTFWHFGVNGVRNGVASALFLLALTYVKKPWTMFLIAYLAFGFHKSTIILILAAVLSWYYTNNKTYLWLWGLSIPISLVAGGYAQSLLAASSLMSGDERFQAYLTGAHVTEGDIQTGMSFRWDFLIYSAMAVAVGWYFVYKKQFRDAYYQWIFNIYLITNAFWVLVIRASFTNRIAQLSWFIMPLVLIYPFMRERFWPDQEKKVGYALLVFYVFAFYYNIIR